MSYINYSRYTKRGLLEYAAENSDRLLTLMERVYTVTTEETTALNEFLADVNQIGTDVGTLATDAQAALTAKDNIIQQQATQIATLQTQAGIDATTIANNAFILASQQAASDAAAADVVSKLTDASTTLKNLDASIVTQDTSFKSPVVTPVPTPVATPPVDTTTPVDTTSPTPQTPPPTPVDTTLPVDTTTAPTTTPGADPGDTSTPTPPASP